MAVLNLFSLLQGNVVWWISLDNPDCGLLRHSHKGKVRFMKGIVHTDIFPVYKMIKLFIYIGWSKLQCTQTDRQTAVSEQTDSLTGSNGFRVSSYLLSPSTDSLILESQINLSPAKLAQVMQTTWMFHVRCKSSAYENKHIFLQYCLFT